MRHRKDRTRDAQQRQRSVGFSGFILGQSGGYLLRSKRNTLTTYAKRDETLTCRNLNSANRSRNGQFVVNMIDSCIKTLAEKNDPRKTIKAAKKPTKKES